MVCSHGVLRDLGCAVDDVDRRLHDLRVHEGQEADPVGSACDVVLDAGHEDELPLGGV